MDSNQFPGAPQSIPVSGPEPGFEPILEFGPKRLRSLWVGVALTVVGFVLSAMLAGSSDDEKTARLRRLVRDNDMDLLLHDRPQDYSGAGPASRLVGRIHACCRGMETLHTRLRFYFMYVWSRDVESYINWRLGKESRVG